LNGILESARSSEVQSSEEFQFGARRLNLITLGADCDVNYSAGLTPWGEGPHGSSPFARPSTIYVVPSGQLNKIPDFSGTQFGPYGSIAGLDTEFTGTNDSASAGRWLLTIDPAQGRLLALEVNQRIAILSSLTALPPREIAEIARPLLHWLAILDGNVVIHAGAVSEQGRGLLITGAGNAGKTTFVRACVEGGMTFHGDNVIEVSPARDKARPPQLWGAYQTLKIRPDPISALPRGASMAWDDEARKSVYFLTRASHATHAEAPVALVRVLSLSPTGDAHVRDLSAASAFFAIAPNTVAQFPYFEKLVLRRVRETVEAVPNITCGRIPYEAIPHRAREMLK
jgi:hypothetical protein